MHSFRLASGSVHLNDTEMLTEQEKQQEFEREKEQRANNQKRRDQKKQQKQSLDATTKGNFSNFRNKSY